MTSTPPVAVQCVDKTVTTDSLGMTLFHEHIFTDNRRRAPRPDPTVEDAHEIWASPMSARLAAHLRDNPMACEDNCVLEDVDVAIDELGYFVRAGGRTVIEQTPIGAGRRLSDLATVAAATGLNIVAGTGFYMEVMHPEALSTISDQEITDRMLHDLTTGRDGVRCGLIGEIGVSADFTPAERRVLQAAGRAHVETGVPVSVHLPGWHRLGNQVLDSLQEEGVPAEAVVLSHMNPSLEDLDYQLSLAGRGAYLSFDMIGIDWYFSHTGFQSPSDMQVAAAVLRLWKAGFGAQILLSGDTFLKMQLRRYGGPGYDHVPRRFASRLQRVGLEPQDVGALLSRNPARVFETAARSARPSTGGMASGPGG